jgi:predicted ATPase/class 3 adenylate cyclase
VTGDWAEPRLATFMLTDIEGSTRLWEERPAAMGPALAIHDGLLRSAIETAGGEVVKTLGDGFLAVFADPSVAVTAAIEAQRSLGDISWGETGPLRVRMGIHTGAAETRDGDYFGPSLNRGARILAIGHGGQVLTSAVTAMLAREGVGPGIDFIDRGSHRLRDIDRPEQIFQVVAPDLPQTFPPLRSLSTRRSNLPTQITSFVGREAELAELTRSLERARLVTLIGTGGTGKTRLMLEAAAGLVDRFPDGVWLAELAPLTDASQIGAEVARALGAPDVPGQPALEVATEFLAAKDLLLLVDNAEHLIDPVAEMAGRLLAHAPGLRMLVTSREALAIPGEVMLQVPSLVCPAIGRGGPSATGVDESLDAQAGTEAVRLFTERAEAVLPSFELTPASIGSVVEICRRLDGIPLAIELAAARVSSMSPEEIARGLGDRFRLLAGGRRTSVPRQQTLHALIDWSWDLLTEDDRRLLRRLSVFTGGWTVESAAAITSGDAAEATDAETPDTGDSSAATLDGLTRLADRSLVNVVHGGSTRYGMLETIRQYARERLVASGEAAAIADRHLAHFTTVAETAAPALRGPAMVDWLDRLDIENDNLATALEWAVESDAEKAIRLCVALLAYWRTRVPSEDADARIVTTVGLARSMVAGPPPPTREQQVLASRLLGAAAQVWAFSGRAATAVEWSVVAVDLARSTGDRMALMTALLGQSVALLFAGQRGSVREWFDEALAVTTELEDLWMIAVYTGGMAGGIARIDPTGAEQALVVATDAARRTGNPYAIAITAMSRGRLFGAQGRAAEARIAFDEAIGRFAELGDERLVLACRSDLAHALRHAGELDEALALYAMTIGEWVRLGNRGAVANQLENVAFLAIERGEAEQAATLLGAAELLREVAASPMSVTEEPEYLEWVERLRATRGPEVTASDWETGRAMSMAEAVALATR